MKKYAGVLKKVRDVEQKRGINYAKPEGTLYRMIRVFYTLAGIYTFAINLFLIISCALWTSENAKIVNVNNMTSLAAAAAISIVVIIAGYVLNRLKLYITGGVLSVAPCVFSIVFFANQLRDSLGPFGYKVSFYWRHFIPLVIMIILMTVMTVIAVRARAISNKLYKKVIENLFEAYRAEHQTDSAILETEWEEYLKNYDPDKQRLQEKKKSKEDDNDR